MVGTKDASGAFEVRMTPSQSAHPALGMFVLDKTYTGALSGIGTGTMLSAGDPTKGSAGYVAIEHFEGTLDDRRGGFALQHSGAMEKGKPSLTIAVVPGSGSGELTGIAGTMTIRVEAGKHFYTLDYTLP